MEHASATNPQDKEQILNYILSLRIGDEDGFGKFNETIRGVITRWFATLQTCDRRSRPSFAATQRLSIRTSSAADFMAQIAEARDEADTNLSKLRGGPSAESCAPEPMGFACANGCSDATDTAAAAVESFDGAFFGGASFAGVGLGVGCDLAAAGRDPHEVELALCERDRA